MHSRAFSQVHPLVQFCFFMLVMLFTMLVSQPVLLIISFSCSMVSGMLSGGKGSGCAQGSGGVQGIRFQVTS